MYLVYMKNKIVGRCQTIGKGQKSRPGASVKQVFDGGEQKMIKRIDSQEKMD
jgi:hypothetical protein